MWWLCCSFCVVLLTVNELSNFYLQWRAEFSLQLSEAPVPDLFDVFHCFSSGSSEISGSVKLSIVCQEQEFRDMLSVALSWMCFVLVSFSKQNSSVVLHHIPGSEIQVQPTLLKYINLNILRRQIQVTAMCELSTGAVLFDTLYHLPTPAQGFIKLMCVPCNPDLKLNLLKHKCSRENVSVHYSR